MDVPARIEIDGGEAVVFTWEDGSVSKFSAADLRAACQCAGCREPDGMEATAAVVNGPVAVTITDAKLVGGYAISFVFGPDGHGTGIYSFSTLRDPADG